MELMFQSLFWWKYCPGEPHRAYAPPAGAGVSILVLVEVLPWDETYIAVAIVLRRFQSLFWWKYCPGRSPRYGPGPLLMVSILVLVEVLPWELIHRYQIHTLTRVSILVLVEVLPWVGDDHLKHTGLFWSFNPCSGGSIALGLDIFPDCGLSEDRFQSLFWWKYCPGLAFPVLCLLFRPVSILVLVEVLPWVWLPSAPGTVISPGLVSILVLVEGPGKISPEASKLSGDVGLVSILVLVGSIALGVG